MSNKRYWWYTTETMAYCWYLRNDGVLLFWNYPLQLTNTELSFNENY